MERMSLAKGIYTFCKLNTFYLYGFTLLKQSLYTKRLTHCYILLAFPLPLYVSSHCA